MNRTRDVDILVGMQYGDEGKGQVAAMLADLAEQQGGPYQWTLRVGGNQAEHRFVRDGMECCARILPAAAAWRHPPILALLGAGHIYRPELLPLEARHLGIEPAYIYADPNAMWLTPEHAKTHTPMAKTRGSTGWGVGAAAAEKVLRRPGTRLVGQSADLVAFLGKGHVLRTSTLVDEIAGPGLVEGSQGALLSLNHGWYPYCTAKDVTPPALLAEAGIPVCRVRRVYGIVKLVVTRVPGPSGPAYGRPLTWDELQERSGVIVPHHRRLNGDTAQVAATTPERIFDFSWEELEYAAVLVGPDALIVTFADLHRPGNFRVRDWDDLHRDTRKLIETISERIAPVVAVRTGPGERDYILLDH